MGVRFPPCRFSRKSRVFLATFSTFVAICLGPARPGTEFMHFYVVPVSCFAESLRFYVVLAPPGEQQMCDLGVPRPLLASLPGALGHRMYAFLRYSGALGFRI